MAEGGQDLPGLPDRVKSLGLPPEATAAIDRYWKPVWAALKDDLRLLPAHPRRAPAPALPAGAEQPSSRPSRSSSRRGAAGA